MSMRTKYIAKMLKAMPSGAERAGNSLQWSKRGGHAGSGMVDRAVKKLEALGFIYCVQANTGGTTPDGSVVTNGSRYKNSDGDTLSYAKRYGVEASDNGFNIYITLNPEAK